MATVAKAHQPKVGPGQYGAIPGGVLSVQFAGDGRIVSAGRDATIRAWSADGKPRGASSANDALLTKVAVSSDGKLAIAGDYNGKVIVWDGAKVTTLRGITWKK
jgi:WD40 repeat protein